MVQYEKSAFVLIKEFAGAHTGNITDVTMAGNRIFACAEGQALVTVITVPVDESESQKIEQKIENQKKEIKEKKK